MSDPLAFNVPPDLAPALSPPPPAPAVESAVTAQEWHIAIVSTLAEVERLLEQAERNGHLEHELTVLGPDTFVVRWR
jgi:hypothetical protein